MPGILPRDTAADGVLGVAILCIRPNGVGVDIDGPGCPHEIGELLLKVGLLGFILIPDWNLSDTPGHAFGSLVDLLFLRRASESFSAGGRRDILSLGRLRRQEWALV